MIHFHVTDPVFKTEPVFILGCTAQEAEAFLKKRYRLSVSIGDRARGTMITRDKSPWRVVWSQAYPNTPKAVTELLHEIFHLVVRICADKGVPIVHHFEDGSNGDEAAAYLFEFFAFECLQRTRRK